MGIVEILLIIFVTLKLLGLIAWSWWWVLSPLWVMFVLYGLLIYLTVINAIYRR